MEQPTDATHQSKPRQAGLDVLRFVAVMLVLGRHTWPPADAPRDGWMAVLLTWQCGGWIGVDLFFVLSGFLVSGLLFTEFKSRGQLSIGRFYMRRGWKIYPPFFFLIAATVIVRQLGGRSIETQSLLAEVLFVQSYVPGLWNHTWSLAVEEHFYLLLPLVLTLMLRLNRASPTPLKPVLIVAACVAVGVLVARVLNWHYRSEYDHLTHSFPSHLRLDSLFFGVAISYAYHFHTSRFIAMFFPWRRVLIVGGILLLTPAFIFPLKSTPFIFTVGFTLLFLASGMLMVGVLLCKLPRSRVITFMATLGAYSYSIYLWHMPMTRWGIPLVEWIFGTQLAFGVEVAVYLAGSLVVGVIMAKIIEVPTLRLRDRWFPSRTDKVIETRPDQPPVSAEVCTKAE